MSNSARKDGMLIGSGIVAGIVASVCCIGPLVLTVIGISGAAVLAKLDFLRWPMVAIVAIVFLAAGWDLYRKRDSCEPGSLCADPKKRRRMVTLYWIGLAIALLAITSPNWVQLIFD